MARQIILDTETTGLEPAQGHRIIEIGCVELLDRKLTGQRFHVYINPEREIDDGAVEVHGLSADFLADKPRFSDIAQDFLDFVEGAELIIHNAPFDVGFINNELRLLDQKALPIGDRCSVIDTLLLARKKHPGQRNSLDALCKRYSIDNSQRSLHGALLDAEILAEVYLAMTGGQIALLLDHEEEAGAAEMATHSFSSLRGERPPLIVIRASDGERTAHHVRLDEIDKASGGNCRWKTLLPSQIDT
jgi:DNA polymerase III subunit epsilon